MSDINKDAIKLLQEIKSIYFDKQSDSLDESNLIDVAIEALGKLAEYEYIGLTPDEIKYFLKDFGISLLMENRVLKKRYKEGEEIISKMAERIKVFEAKCFED